MLYKFEDEFMSASAAIAHNMPFGRAEPYLVPTDGSMLVAEMDFLMSKETLDGTASGGGPLARAAKILRDVRIMSCVLRLSLASIPDGDGRLVNSVAAVFEPFDAESVPEGTWNAITAKGTEAGFNFDGNDTAFFDWVIAEDVVPADAPAETYAASLRKVVSSVVPGVVMDDAPRP